MDEKRFKKLLVVMYGDYKIPVYVDYTIDKNNKVIIDKEQILSNCEERVDTLINYVKIYESSGV
jgi:hypothetical protein